MNKRTVMASLNKIANELDNNGLHNEADTVTKVMSRLAYDDSGDPFLYDLMKDDIHPYGDPDGDDDEYMDSGRRKMILWRRHPASEMMM